MPPLPSLDSEQVARGLARVSHAILRREIDHKVPETIAVVAGIFAITGVIMYWGIVRGGSWKK